MSAGEDHPLAALHENKPNSSSPGGTHHGLHQESMYGRSAAGSHGGAGSAATDNMWPKSDLA
jgi:hypothetical protein